MVLLDHVVLFLLTQHGLPHSVGEHAFVEISVAFDVHLQFVSDSHQEKASVAAIDGDLPYQFVEALVV